MGSVTKLLSNRPNAIPIFLERLKENRNSVILYGAGYCGHETLQLLQKNNIPVSAVCDDFRVGETLDGFNIIDIGEISVNENSVILITSGYNAKMRERLGKLGYLDNYVDIDFGRYEEEHENRNYFLSIINELERTYNLLSDDKSKKVFINLINYRISRDLSYLQGMNEDTEQYFPTERWFGMCSGGYLDLGSYNGDTIKAYLDYTKGVYDYIVGVEASKKNYQSLCLNFAGYKNMEFHQVAVFDRQGELSFTSNEAKNSFISPEGTTVIHSDTVDNILHGRRIDFVKMDVEGAEYHAIRGMKETLQRYTPVLAISVYHMVDDIYRLQLLVEEFCNGKYDYYLRHYSPTVIETVLYAMPK